jgi:TonB-dependent starch-binding outer membrane protein SusC
MNKFYRNTFVFVMMMLMCIMVNAQQRVVTGTIKDQTGTALPGVNVLLKGTSVGTTTDVEGNFSISASAEDVLVISFIGYTTEEIPVGNQTKIETALSEDIATLSEVVVIGYGVQKKVLTTGANLRVAGDDLQKLSTTNALQALQGQAPGVQITSTSGQPGESIKVAIRGVGSIGNNGPLYVVDGVLTGDITYLNSADIQSIDVLKDAASAAIYGSQAANGVVLVTTKKGKKGSRAQITFDSYYGVQNVARKIPMLNAQEYATIRNEAAVNSGKLPYYTADSIANMGKGTDWLDKVLVKDAPTSNYSIGVSGSSESSVYSAGLSYLSQAGIVGGSDLSNYSRYNFRFNSEHNLYKNRVIVGQNLTFAHTDNHGISVGGNYNNALRGAFQTTPLLVDDDADTVGLFNQANPRRQMIYSSMNSNNNQRILGNVYLQIEPVKNLTFRTSIGIDYKGSEGHSYTPDYTLSIYAFNHPNKASQNMYKDRTIILDNLLSYGFSLNDHRFDIMAGTSSYQYTGRFLEASNSDIVFTDLDHAWMTNATNKDGARISIKGGARNPNNRLSYFGRINYNFKETFLLNATFRADGSSQFAASNRWGYFPSVSAGWIMTNSEFLAGTSNWLDFLKLRASWGQVGNQNTYNPATGQNEYYYLAPIKADNTNYSFGPNEGPEGLAPGAYPNRLSNPSLKWETSQQTDIGIDARLMNGKLSLNADYYIKTTKDWLIQIPVLATAGAEEPFVNGGNVTNKGLELALGYMNSLGALNYKFGINGAYNKNEITDIPTPDHTIHPKFSSNQLFNNAPEFYRAEQGYPVGYFWGLTTAGIFQTEEEVTSYTSTEGKLIQPNAQPGDVRYVDRNDDGVIDTKDKSMIGSPIPKYTFGFSISVDYKGFDFSVLANGVAGNTLVQSYRDQSSQFGNYTTAILDRWHGPGSSNTIPRVTENNSNWTEFSDLYTQKGDFLRIGNVTIGYNLSNIWKNKFVSQFRIYASALNLHTFTKYTGMDPEIGYGPDPMGAGIDLGYYPRPRTYMVGVNIKF